MPTAAEIIESKSGTLASFMEGDITPEAAGAESTGLEEAIDTDDGAVYEAGDPADDNGSEGDEPSPEELAAEEADALEGEEDGKPAGEAAAAADAETPATPTSEEMDTLRAQAALGTRFSEQFAASPSGTILALINEVAQYNAPEARALLAQLTQLAPQAAAPKPADEPTAEDLEGLTPQEVWVEKNKRTMEGLAQQAATLRDLPQALNQALSQRDYIIGNSALAAEQLRHEVRALAQAVGLEMPTLDQAAVMKAVQGGKTLEQAVAEQYEPATKKALAKLQQAAKPRPKTPGAGSASVVDPPGSSLAAIMRSRGWM